LRKSILARLVTSATKSFSNLGFLTYAFTRTRVRGMSPERISEVRTTIGLEDSMRSELRAARRLHSMAFWGSVLTGRKKSVWTGAMDSPELSLETVTLRSCEFGTVMRVSLNARILVDLRPMDWTMPSTLQSRGAKRSSRCIATNSLRAY